jgi:predicted phage terminase large subunit-like protein
MTRKEKLEFLSLLEEKERRTVAETIDCSKLTREESNEIYREVMASENTAAQRKLCKEDLFFLLTVGCKRKDADKDWLYARCREVQASPDGHLDLWAREHYKSTIITFAKSIQDLLRDPDNTCIGILSHTRPIAKGFLDQIKRELEGNEYLKNLFPDVLYEKPSFQSTKWSLDGGITVKRKTNPKEASVEAWGLVDGQPTSKHFSVLVYDDVVTRESVTTPDQIKKVTSAWELSLNLGAHGGRQRYIGTRYHVNDTYRTMMDRESVQPRIYPATSDGKLDGEPVFLDRETLLKKRRDMGPYTFGTQMLQDPVADKAMSFKPEWLMYYDKLADTSKWNKYLIVDPASSKKSNSDYTVMAVIGLAPDNNYYLIDAIRDRLNLTQRAAKLFELQRTHMPKNVGYEKYGMQADIEHIKYVMEEKNYRFNITELGGATPKEDRIKKLVPIFEQKRVYLPKQLVFSDYEGRTLDFVKLFLEDEYLAFPVCVHDDMLDDIARILDPVLGAEFPKIAPKKQNAPQGFGGSSGSWMG